MLKAEAPRVEGNPHVIVGEVAGAAMVNLGKSWRPIRKRAGLDAAATATAPITR